MTPVADVGEIQAARSLQSDGMFRMLEERVRSKPDVQKAIDAMFLFDITVDGKNAAYWSMN